MSASESLKSAFTGTSQFDIPVRKTKKPSKSVLNSCFVC
nr:MAG TPA: hypothetical protein [Caudoviricetes sp.]